MCAPNEPPSWCGYLTHSPAEPFFADTAAHVRCAAAVTASSRTFPLSDNRHTAACVLDLCTLSQPGCAPACVGPLADRVSKKKKVRPAPNRESGRRRHTSERAAEQRWIKHACQDQARIQRSSGAVGGGTEKNPPYPASVTTGPCAASRHVAGFARAFSSPV